MTLHGQRALERYFFSCVSGLFQTANAHVTTGTRLGILCPACSLVAQISTRPVLTTSRKCYTGSLWEPFCYESNAFNIDVWSTGADPCTQLYKILTIDYSICQRFTLGSQCNKFGRWWMLHSAQCTKYREWLHPYSYIAFTLSSQCKSNINMDHRLWYLSAFTLRPQCKH